MTCELLDTSIGVLVYPSVVHGCSSGGDGEGRGGEAMSTEDEVIPSAPLHNNNLCRTARLHAFLSVQT